MFRWIIGWMAGQEVSRCASDDPTACIWMPVSVPMRLDDGNVEGGEPMMTMLRCSEIPVIVAVGFLVRMDLRQARTMTAKVGLTGNIVDMTMKIRWRQWGVLRAASAVTRSCAG